MRLAEVIDLNIRASSVRAGALFVLSLALIMLIAVGQHRLWFASFDTSMMMAAGRVRDTTVGEGLTAVMILASLVGDTVGRIVMTLMACAMLLAYGRQRQWPWLVATVIGGTLLNLAFKQIFAAPRPGLLQHLDAVTSYSFPSGHAAGNLIFFGALAMLVARKWFWTAAAIVIALIGISRVWLGVHWPTDVMAGWIEGIGWLLLCRAYLPRSTLVVRE